MFQLRKRIEKKIRETFKADVGDCEFYFASLSSQTVVYKGMVRSEILSEFYQDLKNENFKVSFSVTTGDLVLILFQNGLLLSP